MQGSSIGVRLSGQGTMARIFLSSTFQDLATFRDTARHALEKNGHTVELMEGILACDDRPVEDCCRRVSECDLYVCILAHRYGSRSPDPRYGGKSVTELEYWSAVEHNIDCLFFLLSDDVLWLPKHVDDGDSKVLLNAFKSHVHTNHSFAPFQSPDNLAFEMSAAVGAWQKRQELAEQMAGEFAPGGNTRFQIVSNDPENRRSVTRVAAQFLWSEVKSRAQRGACQLHIGFVGGPTTRQIIDSFADLVGRKHDKLPVLGFVALNSAGELHSFQNSANYQVTRLAELLGGIHIASPPHRIETDDPVYEGAVKELDVLLCSCGERDGFLVEWLRRKAGQLPASGKAISESIIGDFCLTPIDALGRAAELTSDAAHLIAELRPRPGFRQVHDLRSKHRTIIFPLVSHLRTFTADTRVHGRPTYKGDAVRAVLRSGVIDLCILSEEMARALLAKEPPMNWSVPPHTELCGLRLIRETGTDALGGLFLARDLGDQEILLRVVQSSTRPSESVEVTQPDVEVIVSDPPCGADLDDRNERLFPLYIGGQLRTIFLSPRVRKPGFWTTTAARVAAAELSHHPSEDGYRILDLGCGSGVIGAFIAASNRVSQLVFSDISKTAVRCACKNAKKLKIHKFEGRVGDMFQTISVMENFDLIVFGAPFLPCIPGVSLEDIDCGGKTGSELAERFVSQVRAFLADGACAVTYFPDYIDSAPIKHRAVQAGLHYRVIDKFILYPFEPKFGFPLCHEITYRRQLEEATGYRFREEWWAGRRYICFKMVFFLLFKADNSEPV